MTAQTKVQGRQHPLSACVNAGIAQIGTGNEVVFKVPPGAYVDNVDFQVITAFDGTGAVTGNLTDGTTVFIAAQTLKAIGAVTAAVLKKYYPNGGTLTLSIADANSNSANGQLVGFVNYKSIYRADEVQE